MNSCTILFSRKKFSYKNIGIKEIPSKRKINDDLELACKKKWQQIIRDTGNKNKKIWDSQVYRLESCNLKDGDLSLLISTIPFSVRLSLNSFTKKIKELGLDYAAQGMFSSCFLETGDESFIFLKKSGRYHTTRQYSFIGGVLSKDEKVLVNGKDLFSEVQKEIKEETGCPIEIENISLVAGYATENFNFCLIFHAKTKLTFSEIKALGQEIDDEIARIIKVKRGNILEFSRQYLLPRDYIKFEIVEL